MGKRTVRLLLSLWFQMLSCPVFMMGLFACYRKSLTTFLEKEPANHVAENVKRMRQIQRKCRQKQREEVASAPVPVKALWKSQKYETIPSRLGEYLHSSPACTPVRFYQI